MKHLGREWRTLAAAAAVCVLAGCAAPCHCGPNSPWLLYTNDHPISTMPLYAPPFGVPAERAVTIRGSQGLGFRTFVWAVDGKPVLDAAAHWFEPLVLSPDETHRLSLAYDGGDTAGTIQIEFTGERGSALVVRAADVLRHGDAEMWLADAASQANISEKFLVHLGIGRQPAAPNAMIILVVAHRHR